MLHLHLAQRVWDAYLAKQPKDSGFTLDEHQCKLCHETFPAQYKLLTHIGVDHSLMEECRVSEEGERSKETVMDS